MARGKPEPKPDWLSRHIFGRRWSLAGAFIEDGPTWWPRLLLVGVTARLLSPFAGAFADFVIAEKTTPKTGRQDARLDTRDDNWGGFEREDPWKRQS
jgi:hypothetical protein